MILLSVSLHVGAAWLGEAKVSHRTPGEAAVEPPTLIAPQRGRASISLRASAAAGPKFSMGMGVPELPPLPAIPGPTRGGASLQSPAQQAKRDTFRPGPLEQIARPKPKIMTTLPDLKAKTRSEERR